MQVNGVVFTNAAEEAAWEPQAKEVFHALGEEIVRDAASVLLMPVEVRHLNGVRIAGEITAKAGRNAFCVRRAFAGIGAELEIRIGYDTDILRNDEMCDLEMVQTRVRTLAMKHGIPCF